MKDPIRRAVAYITTAICNKKPISSFYDEQDHRAYNFDCEVHGLNISVYDRAEHCRITGNCNEGVFSLHHDGEGQYLKCEIKNPTFKGYDYATGNSYLGQVGDHYVTIFDKETGKHYDYAFQ